MILAHSPVIYFLVFLVYVECSPTAPSAGSCDSENGCSSMFAYPSSTISYTTATTSIISNKVTTTMKFPSSKSNPDAELEATFHQAKVHDKHKAAIDSSQTTNDLNVEKPPIAEEVHPDINEQTQAHKEKAASSGGLDTVETVAISVIGMLVVAGVGVGFLVWRNSSEDPHAYLEDKIDKDWFPDRDSHVGHEFPVEFVRTPLDAFQEERDTTRKDEHGTRVSKQALFQQLDKYFARIKDSPQSTDTISRKSQLQTHMSIPLQLQQRHFSTSNLANLSSSTSSGSDSDHQIQPRHTSLERKEEEELERTREFFLGFETDEYSLTLLEQELFNYEPPARSNFEVFDPRLEEGLLRPFSAFDRHNSMYADSDGSGSPLAHYIRKFLGPPARGDNDDSSNKIDVVLHNESESDAATIAENNEQQLVNPHHLQDFYTDSEQSSPSSSYYEFFKDLNSQNEIARNENVMDSLEDVHRWTQKRDEYVQRYGAPKILWLRAAAQQLEKDNTGDTSDASGPSQPGVEANTVGTDIDKSDLKQTA